MELRAHILKELDFEYPINRDLSQRKLNGHLHFYNRVIGFCISHITYISVIFLPGGHL